MPHHGHLVQGRLTVKQENVIIQQVTIHRIPVVQHNLLRVHVFQRNHAPVLAHNCLRTRPRIRAVLNELVELIQIIRRNTFGFCEIHRNLQRHADFCNTQVRIRRNNRTRRELDALSLNVVTDASLLASQTLLDRLEWTTAALGRRRDTRNIIVHQRRYMILYHVCHLINDILTRTSLDFLLKGLIVFNDIEQFVGQVIFRALIVVLHHRRTNLRRRDAQHRANHPIRAAPVTTETHEIHVLVRNTAKQAMNVLHFQRLQLLELLIVRHNLGNALARELIGLRRATPVLALLATTLDVR